MSIEIAESANNYGMKLRHILRGHHRENIWQIAWSPDGTMLASSSCDSMLCLWDSKTGQHLRNLTGHIYWVMAVAWSPDGTVLASGSSEHEIRLWNPYTGETIRTLTGHLGDIYSLAWSPNGTLLASSSYDDTIRLWDPKTGRSIQKLIVPGGHKSTVESVEWSPDGTVLASGSYKSPIRLWDPRTGKITRQIGDYSTQTSRVIWFTNDVLVASDSRDQTIKLWDPHTGQHLNTLEGQNETITSLSLNHDGCLLASKSLDGEVRIWRTDTWDLVAKLEKMVTRRDFNPSWFGGLAFHPASQTLARASVDRDEIIIQIWDLDVDVLLSSTSVIPSIHYTNAKVVLLGDSGVGKSGLSLVLTGQPFTPTESTHARHVHVFENQEIESNGKVKETRETLLWDLAGQPGYRLIHQLHLNEASVGLVLFDAHSETDPFAGVYHWVRALRLAQRVQGNAALPLKKLLIAARVDRGGKSISSDRINELVQELEFDGYVETSAKEGLNIVSLSARIKNMIDWEMLPKVTSTNLFQLIKKFLITEKEAARLLSPCDDLYRAFLKSESASDEKEDSRPQFETCIGRVESQGLIKRLSFGGLILLQPELLDAYASALINGIRDEPDGLGSITEERVRACDFAIPKDERIANYEQEKLLLIAMIEDLLNYEIALREQGDDGAYLVFPSQSTREKPDLPNIKGKAVIFSFEGPIQNIYATLAVRLSHTGLFKKLELWKNAVTYTTKLGGTYGLYLNNIGEGHAELILFFDDSAREETRFHFEEYVKAHLQRRALSETIYRRRIFQCSNCNEPLTDSQVTRRREGGHKWLNCPVCDVRIGILDGKERLAGTPISRVPEMDHSADQQRDKEVANITVQGKIESSDFGVFLCYNNEDKSRIKHIGEQLKEYSILPWLDEWELRPGLSWQRALEAQIGSIKSAAVFVGKSGIGPWQNMELEAFLGEFVRRGCPIIPVVLADAPDKPELPLFLRNMAWVDFRKQEPNPIEQLMWGITGKRIRH